MFSHFLGPIFGVPQLLGWVRGWVWVEAAFWCGVNRGVNLGVCQGVSLGVCQGVSLRVRLARRLGGGVALVLGLRTRSRCSWAALGEGKRRLQATL